MKPIKLGILATHPIQYYAPLFRAAAAWPSTDVLVYFAHRPTPRQQGIGFGVSFEWDVDLIGGFRHQFLRNHARNPGVGHFAGCDTPEIGEIIKHERFDAFLVMGWHARSYWQAMRECWRTGTPLLVRGDSQLRTDRMAIKRAVKRLLYPAFMRRFAACLSVGTRSEEYFRYYGARRVFRSPHFVDNEFFAKSADEARCRRGMIRAQLGIPADAFVALFVGKLVPKKRPLDLIEALRADGSAVGLMVGDGTLRDRCEAAAAGGPTVRFSGFRNQSELPEMYAVADVLVLPSDARETWGLVVNEAMASGVPALVSDGAGCAPDLIVEGESGYSFRTGDVRTLAMLLSRMQSQPHDAMRMGTAAALHVRQFSVDSAVHGLFDAVKAVRPIPA